MATSVLSVSPDGLLDLRQVADRLGCSAVTVRRLHEAGQLAAVKISPRLIRFEPDEVARYIESRRRQSPN
jgi:excisionase family DNA binding protein